MQLSTITMPQLTDVVNRVFVAWPDTVDQNFMKSGLVKNVPVPLGTGQSRIFAELPDRDIYARIKDEGDNTAQSVVQYGLEKAASIYRIGLEIAITVEERKFNKNADVVQKLTDLSQVCTARMELDLSHRFGFAYSTSYTTQEGKLVDITTGDNVALASTSHALTGSSTTYSNIIPSNPLFSKGALEAAQKVAVEQTYNNIGLKLTMKFDIIWTTDDRNTINQVQELLNSTANPTSQNAGAYNVYKGGMTHVILPLVATTATGAPDTTKAKYWGIASSANSQLQFGVAEAPYLKTPTEGNNGEDFSTENWRFGAHASIIMAVVSGRWVKFSNGTGV